MRFLKKYWLALTAAILSVALVVGLGGWLIRRAVRRDYYPRWIMDEAAMLNDEAKWALSDMNEALDGKYGSIIAVVTAENLDGVPAAEYLYDRWETYGFGQNDFALLLVKDGTWFLSDGDAMANYSGKDTSLRDILAQEPDANAQIKRLTTEAPVWYQSHVPAGSGNYGRAAVVTGGGFLGALGWTVLFLALGLLLFRNLIYPLFLLADTGRWIPFRRRKKHR